MDFMISSSSVFERLAQLSEVSSEVSKVNYPTKKIPEVTHPSLSYRYYQSPSSRVGSGSLCISEGSLDCAFIFEQLSQDPSFLYSLIHPEDLPAFEASVDLQASVGDRWHHQCRLVMPAGEVRWIEGSATVVEIQFDGTRVWDGTFVDVTDKKLLTYQRERLLELERVAQLQAERAARSKDEFLTVVSHELKTPLTPILGWLSLLRSNKPDPQTLDRGLDTIQNSVEKHIALIEQLLDASRIVCDKISVNPSRFDFSALVLDAVEVSRRSLPQSSHDISLAVTPGDFTCLGDSFRLNQVVSQLLSNAAKFTPPPGRIDVSLYTDQGFICLDVSDTGSGISPDFLPSCFQFFSHEDSTDTRSTSGLGLGLAIVRHLVELHGGVVFANSLGKGKGSTFTIKLPSAASVNSFSA